MSLPVQGRLYTKSSALGRVLIGGGALEAGQDHWKEMCSQGQTETARWHTIQSDVHWDWATVTCWKCNLKKTTPVCEVCAWSVHTCCWQEAVLLNTRGKCCGSSLSAAVSCAWLPYLCEALHCDSLPAYWFTVVVWLHPPPPMSRSCYNAQLSMPQAGGSVLVSVFITLIKLLKCLNIFQRSKLALHCVACLQKTVLFSL